MKMLMVMGLTEKNCAGEKNAKRNYCFSLFFDLNNVVVFLYFFVPRSK